MEAAGKRKRIVSSRYSGSDWATDAEYQESEIGADEEEQAREPKKKQKQPVRQRQHTQQGAAAAAPPRLTPKQRRHQRLSAALAARGLQLRADSRLCWGYINDNTGDIDIIVNVMDEMRFYFDHTKYEDYREKECHEAKVYKGYWDTDEVSDVAKSLALEEWASRFGSLAEAAAQPELPASLVSQVLQLRLPLKPASTSYTLTGDSLSDDSAGYSFDFKGRSFGHKRRYW